MLPEDEELTPRTTVKSITYDDYLKLTGLLLLAREHKAMLDRFRDAMLTITGETADFTHTCDAVWESYSAAELLGKLGIPVPQAPEPVTASAEEL